MACGPLVDSPVRPGAPAPCVYGKRALKADERRTLVSQLSANLRRGIGESGTDTVLLRSFSALDLSIFAALEERRSRAPPAVAPGPCSGRDAPGAAVGRRDPRARGRSYGGFMPTSGGSAVLTLRVPPELDRRIAAEARRRRRTKSEILHEVLQGALQQGRAPEGRTPGPLTRSARPSSPGRGRRRASSRWGLTGPPRHAGW